MPAASLAEKYAVGAALTLLFLVLLDNAVIMAAVSAVGLIGGLWVLRTGDFRRAAMVAVFAFALALAFAVVALLR
ncbi:MAG: hypothetical protein ACUVR4_02175 [Anaerolineae bacterium]